MAARPRPLGRVDPADAVARVVQARGPQLLGIHRHRLARADLEDCLQQAALELLTRARSRGFQSDEHITNALQQRFLSRVSDRHRALGGRSPAQAAFAAALSTGQGTEEETPVTERVADPRPSVEEQVQARLTLSQLREVAEDLTRDQRVVLACQNIGLSSAEVCAREGWSAAKFRKVAQRGRARVVALVADHDAGERCLSLRDDLVALFSHTASETQATRAQLHLANCPSCARMAHEAAVAARGIAALLPPVPVLRDADAPNRLAAVFGHLRRLLPGGAEHADTAVAAKAGAAGAAGVSSAAGGATLAGGGALKLGVAALCAAGTVGTVAVCEHAGVLQGDPTAPLHQRHIPKHAAVHRHAASASAAARAPAPVTASIAAAPASSSTRTTSATTTTARPRTKAASTSASTASNEFGFEGAGGAPASSSRSSSAPVARSASASSPSTTSSHASSSSTSTAPARSATSEFGFEG